MNGILDRLAVQLLQLFFSTLDQLTILLDIYLNLRHGGGVDIGGTASKLTIGLSYSCATLLLLCNKILVGLTILFKLFCGLFNCILVFEFKQGTLFR